MHFSTAAQQNIYVSRRCALATCPIESVIEKGKHMKVVLDHLTKKFPSRVKGAADVVAVSDFNFEVPDGKLVALLGPSGCGKSTTLNLICGLIKPSAGRIYFGDDDVSSLEPEHRGVGMVFQNYALYPHLTVYQNIIFPLENLRGDAKLTKEQMREKAEHIAELVEIGALLDRKPAELSGGQQQRVAIARALVKMPRVLLLDEPLSNLDARLRLQTREEIRRIQKATGITTLFVTHDQDEAMSISDLIVVMRDGVLQQIGEPQAVYSDPKNLFVASFLGTPAVNVFSASVKSGALYVGDECVMSAAGVKDGEVWLAVRPEGLVPSDNGTLTLTLRGVEVMGRDVSVLAESGYSNSGIIRAIVSSDEVSGVNKTSLKFEIKKTKAYIFDKKTEERLYTAD